MTWKEVCSTFRLIVGADLEDEFFTSSKSMAGASPDIAMKSTEKVNDYILRFRAALQKIGEDQLGDKMQVFMFTHSLLPELKEECAVQMDGKQWPSLQAAINAALGAQKRLHASQPAKRAKLAAVHAVAHDGDAGMFVPDEVQHDAGYPEEYVQDQAHTLAAVQQRRPGSYQQNAQRGFQHRSGQGSQQQNGYQQRHGNHHMNSNMNRTSNAVAQQQNAAQPAATFGAFKAMVRPILQSKGWCGNCGSNLHSDSNCDRSGFLYKAPRFNDDQLQQ